MRKLAIGLIVCWTLAHVNAAEPGWMTSLPKAQAQAKKEQKMVLLDFTGSDWCPWCIRFDKEVFSKREFKDYAAKHLVLVKLDFPHKKAQSAELKKANKELLEKYGVSGFPTFIVLNSDGKKIGEQVGYAEGGPKAFIAKLEGFKKEG